MVRYGASALLRLTPALPDCRPQGRVWPLIRSQPQIALRYSRRLLRRMLVVPLERSLEDLLLAMRRSRVHFALVTEADGTTAGLVTLDDLLEELVGEITDERDRP